MSITKEQIKQKLKSKTKAYRQSWLRGWQQADRRFRREKKTTKAKLPQGSLQDKEGST